MAKNRDRSKKYEHPKPGTEMPPEAGAPPPEPELVTPEPAPVSPDAVESAPEKKARLKQELEEKARKCAREDVNFSDKWKSFKKLLGISRKGEKDEAVVKAEENFEEALWKYVEAERENLPAGDKESARALLKYIYLDGAAELRSIKADETVNIRKEKDNWSDKYVKYYKKGKDWWKGLSLKKKLAYSGAVFAVGATGVGASFASIGAMTLAAKASTRVLGAGVMYESAMKWQETLDVGEAEYMANQEIDRMLEKVDWENRIKNLSKEEVIGAFKDRKETFESQDLLNKRRAYFLAVALPAVATVVDVYRWGTGKGFLGKLAKETPAGGAKVPDSLEKMRPKSPLEEMAQRTPASGADANVTKPMRDIYEGEKIKPAGPSSAPKTEQVVSDNKPAAGKIAEVVQPEPEKISSGKIEAHGGYRTLWGSAYNSIMEKPERYGLDPTSGNLRSQARQMANDLMHGYANKLGISYEKLNELASSHVQKGDAFEIVKKIDGNYEFKYGGHAFDSVKPPVTAEVPQAEISGKSAVAEEAIAKEDFIREKTKILQDEYLKYKSGGTSASSVHEYKGGGHAEKIPGMKEIEADYQKDLADRKYARAVRAEQELQTLHSRGVSYLNDPTLRVSQEISYQDSVKLDNIRSLIQNRGFFTHLFDVKYLDWDKLASDYTMGHEGQIPAFPENQTWEDFQRIKFREEMVKALRKKIGPEGKLSLKEWLSRISNQEFKSLETDVRNRIYQ